MAKRSPGRALHRRKADALGTGEPHKIHAFICRNVEVHCQQIGDLFGRAPLVCLDLLDEYERTAHAARELILRQVQDLTPAFKPGAERCFLWHRDLVRGIRELNLYGLMYGCRLRQVWFNTVKRYFLLYPDFD